MLFKLKYIYILLLLVTIGYSKPIPNYIYITADFDVTINGAVWGADQLNSNYPSLFKSLKQLDMPKFKQNSVQFTQFLRQLQPLLTRKHTPFKVEFVYSDYIDDYYVLPDNISTIINCLNASHSSGTTLLTYWQSIYK